MNALSIFFLSVLLLTLAGCGEVVADNKTEAAGPVVTANQSGVPQKNGLPEGYRYLTPEEEFAETKKKAEAGDAAAQFNFGLKYQNGESVPKDAAKAAEWYEKAAAQNHADAQSKLGWMYARGEGVPKNAAKVIAWTQKAAAQGDASAQLNLGGMYAKGIGVPKDVAKALELVRKAAAQGYAEAQYALGDVYRSGFEGFVPKDAAKSVEWFQKAAAQGHERAQKDLAQMYARGEGVTKDLAKVVELWEKAAAQGNVGTQRELARMYDKGEGGVPKNAVKAAEWYQKAAAQGDAYAQYDLGRVYGIGEGVPKDDIKAFEWTQKAAVQGHGGAQLNLSYMYNHGEGVPKDNVLAYAWLNLHMSQVASGGWDISYQDFVQSMSAAAIAEGQRLSSNWKKGDTLQTSGDNPSGSTSPDGQPTRHSTGTAFVVSNNGHALTNHHVINGCTEVKIAGREGIAKVITSDRVNDLALLQLPGNTKDVASLNPNSGRLRQGEDIIVFGYPLNSVLSSGGNLTQGIISATTGIENNTNQIQITAPIQGGSSGSPVMDKKGNVVGVVSSRLDMKAARITGTLPQNVNFAVNGQTAIAFLDANKVPYKTGRGLSSREMSNADIAEEARKWTVLVECWK